MTLKSKSRSGASGQAALWRYPVFTLGQWASVLQGHTGRARERARYYSRTGRLRRLARGLYAVVPLGAEAGTYQPDPYLVAAALRPDAILSHHAALDLLGAARSVFAHYTYFTSQPRRALMLDGRRWTSLRHPPALVRSGKTDLGTKRLDRQGVIITVTGPERTLVDGFAVLPWVGGLEEHVESCAGFRDLEVSLIDEYLRLLDRRILYGALGWFLETHPETADSASHALAEWAARVPRQPLYLGGRTANARLQARWNVLVPATLGRGANFEGAG